MIASIFFFLFLILAIIKLTIRYDGKKRFNKLSNEIAIKSKEESEKRKLEVKNNPYRYKYWNKIIDGSETIEIDKSEVSSQILLDNWDFISKYYYVIKEEVKAMRNDSDFKEEHIISDLSFNHDLTKVLYKKNLDLIKPTIIDFLTNILENKQKLRKSDEKFPLKAISIIYFLQGNYNFHLSAEPSRVFHNEKYSKYVPEFKFEHEFNIDIHEIETAILKDLNITAGDYDDVDESYVYDLFSKMMVECWKIAKQKTNSDLLGSLDYGTGGIDYDLDTGESIDEFNIKQYYKNKNIKIERYLED
ncbi:hypothetical protein [Winogradskyella psychrotolerans]|uniref:hypothetical protein n=1 Tax=Winogradskyella psychrotolerans TaxID=1344585 RepID=UPI001C072439|nr:hypothetical protein [Winogradskyella psychrotolerans]MBU2928199.1 hypothetical protein [Winogradskyella psychrotolerans]